MTLENAGQGNWVLSNSSRIVNEMRDLTVQVRSIGHVLATSAAPFADIRAVLGEVAKTYRAVNDAIARFVAPAFGRGDVDPAPFVEMERSGLTTLTQQSRGHCGLILTHYGRVRGVRDWLRTRVPPPQLEAIDRLFARLGTADGDLFRPLIDIGEMLTNDNVPRSRRTRAGAAAASFRSVAGC